ncbi:hypothetical protein ACUN8C_16600 [Kushneria sp. Sum13]|uniref:hypothetical protein n=1 Tax=Kushneria sp. Sum13 TaxID=3459196 RepID=UPI00404530F7
MLRCYPIEATYENWLNESITSMVRLVHYKLDQDIYVGNDQTCWERFVQDSVVEDKRSLIKPLTGIRDRIFNYKDELHKLSHQQRANVLSAMQAQSSVELLIDGTQEIKIIKNNYPGLHEAAKKLFSFCYEKLTELKVRERQYRIIFNSLSDKICPFCGIERVMNPEETAQDQDHYLAKSIYPFAAANMRNLVPMCRCCNRDYKHDKDILTGSDGYKRHVFDPYDCNPPKISLANSTLILDSFPIKFKWKIEFLTETEASETWDQVFSIRTRYERDILNQYFDTWMKNFCKKCEKDRKRNNISRNLTKVEVRERLSFYQEDKSESPSIGLAGFLEPLVFSLLLQLYDEGNERVVNLIRDAVLGISLEDD